MLQLRKTIISVILLAFVFMAPAVTLFEIKDEVGSPVLVVSSDGLRILNGADTLMVISSSAIKAYIDDSKALSRSFSVTTASSKGSASSVLDVTTDGLNIYDQSGLSKALGDTLMTISSKSIKAHIKSGSKGLSRSFSVSTASSKGDQTKVLEVATDSMALRGGVDGSDYSDFSPENIFIGSQAGNSITDGKYNLFLGNKSGFSTAGDYIVQDPDVGSKNLFAGYESGYSNIDGKLNVYLGYQSGYNNQHGSYNVHIGHQSGLNSTESSNTFVGNQSGMNNTSGFFNSFYGTYSGGSNEQGYSNTFIGYSAGFYNKNGNHNTALGLEAGSKQGGTGNTSVGSNAGKTGYQTETNNNTNIGYFAGYGNRGSGNVFLGANAGRVGTYISESLSNRLMISNDNSTPPLIQGYFPNNSIYLNADSVKVRALVSGSGSAVYRNTTTGFLVTSSSDIRLKENIQPIENGLDKVLRLQGVNYAWKSDDKHQRKIGLIAQEVEKVLPELVFTNEADGYKGINYAEITAVLIEAVKELKKEVNITVTEAEENRKMIGTQNEKIGILINENKELKNEVSELKNLRAEIEMLKKHIKGYATN